MGKFKKIELRDYDDLMLIEMFRHTSLGSHLTNRDITCDEYFDCVCQLFNEIIRKRADFGLGGGGFSITKDGKEIISSLETAELSDVYKRATANGKE